MAKKWERSEAVVAQRINAGQIGGMLSKKVQVLESEVALLEEEGRTLRTFGRGKHKVGGMFAGGGRNVIFVDRSPHVIRREVKGLWTRDDKEIVAAVEAKFMVADPDKLAGSMMGKRDIITNEDLWSDLKDEVGTSVMAPVVKKKGIDQLQGDTKTVKELQVSAEVGLRRKLEEAGLTLLSFSVRFVLPGEYEDYLRKRGVMREETAKHDAELELETKEAVHDREVGEIKGEVPSREQALDEMEQERMKREAELGIEEEETQQDMRDAMEALKLKEIKDKQKIVKDSERKRLGLDTLKEGSVSEPKKLEKRYDELQKVLEATEKKYLSRKIDRDSFNKMMREFNQEKTEIEVKMKKKGKGKKGG